MDDLLLPQRMLFKKNKLSEESSNPSASAPRSSVAKFRQKISRTKPLSLLEKAEMGAAYIQEFSDQKFQRPQTAAATTDAQPLLSIIDLISERMLLIERFLPSLDLISLSMTSKRLNDFFRSLRFDCRLKLHHVAQIIRSSCGFGIFVGCQITIGDGQSYLLLSRLSRFC
jgi:hypothetical protein